MDSSNVIRIMIAEDHALYLNSLVKIIGKYDSINVISTAQNGQEFLDKMRSEEVDLVLLDIRMPILDGMETAKIIKKEYPKIRIMMLTMHNRVSIIKKMMQIGIHGYILKNTGIEEMIKAIHIVADGGRYYGEEVKDKIIDDVVGGFETIVINLTTIEKEIITLISAGNNMQQISNQLDLCDDTIQKFLNTLFSKTETNTTESLVRWAYESGMIES